MKRHVVILIVVTLALFTFSCATEIPAIQKDPQRYSGKTVAIRGEVMNVINIPLVDVSIFLFGNSEVKAPAFSSVKHTRGEEYVMKARVMAFPEDETKDASEDSIRAIADFLVEHDIAESGKAEKVGAAVLNGLYKVSEGLGRLFFLIEEEAVIR